MNLPSIESFYKHPYVLHQEWEDLVIFNYSHECQYDKVWDDVTLNARGIIFNKDTGALIARAFLKFFNLFEHPSTYLDALPSGPFTVTEKVDGSLGIHFKNRGYDYVATRGSFQSEQAQWATRWFREHVKSQDMMPDYTYLFEIIYAANKIVISYDFEGLVLLGCIHKETGIELPYEDVAREAAKIGVQVVRRETGFNDINDLYTYCKKLPHTQEGFVITFSNGLKVKIKGDAYCMVHKMVSRMTPLAFWEAWDLKTRCIPKEFLAQVPEEFRETCDELNRITQDMHMQEYHEALTSYEGLVSRLGTEDKKTFAITAKMEHQRNFSLIMALYNKKIDTLWKDIHKRVRPTNNLFPNYVPGYERIRRIQAE